MTRLPITLNRLDPFCVSLQRIADALLWHPVRPIRIAATDDVNLHRVTGLVSLGGLDCDTELSDGWVTITVRAKEAEL